jgi:integrase
MSIPGRNSTAAMLARTGFVVVLVLVNGSGFRLVLARGWHGAGPSAWERARHVSANSAQQASGHLLLSVSSRQVPALTLPSRDTGLVFTTRYGTPIEPRNFSRSFDRRIAKAGVPRITVHGARKTCGSLLAALDVHPRVAMQILRHSKIALTMEIYTEVPSAATRDALKKLGSWLDA